MSILKNAFMSVVDMNNLLSAHKSAMRGKRAKFSATSFNYDLIHNVINLQSELIDGSYRPMPYRHKIVIDPKTRLIEAPAYRDQIVHHALYAFLSPFFERHFIADSYACRPNRGIHKAVARIQSFLRSMNFESLYACQIDVSKYYASINHERLLEILIGRIDDPQLISLLKTIINSTDSGHEHDHLFPADSHYFTKGRRGIPIGNLTSQLFANIYLHEADMFAKQHLKIRHYVRYMDDILFFHHDKAQLHLWQQAMSDFLYQNLCLTVNPRKVRIYPARQGVSFVGYVIYPYSLRLRGSSVRRYKKRYRSQLVSMGNDRLSLTKLRTSFESYKAHAGHAKSQGLIDKLEAMQQDYLFIRSINRYHKRHAKSAPTKSVQLSLFDDK